VSERKSWVVVLSDMFVGLNLIQISWARALNGHDHCSEKLVVPFQAKEKCWEFQIIKTYLLPHWQFCSTDILHDNKQRFKFGVVMIKMSCKVITPITIWNREEIPNSLIIFASYFGCQSNLYCYYFYSS
jgi:hypothetical protein